MTIEYRVFDVDRKLDKFNAKTLSQYQAGDTCSISPSHGFSSLLFYPCGKNGEIAVDEMYTVDIYSSLEVKIYTNLDELNYFTYIGKTICKPMLNSKVLTEEGVSHWCSDSEDIRYLRFPFVKAEFPMFLHAQRVITFFGDLNYIHNHDILRRSMPDAWAPSESWAGRQTEHRGYVLAGRAHVPATAPAAVPETLEIPRK